MTCISQEVNITPIVVLYKTITSTLLQSAKRVGNTKTALKSDYSE